MDVAEPKTPISLASCPHSQMKLTLAPRPPFVAQWFHCIMQLKMEKENIERKKCDFPLALPQGNKKRVSRSKKKKINKSMGRVKKKNLPPQCGTSAADGLWESRRGKSIWPKDKTTRTSTKCAPHIIDTMLRTHVLKTQYAKLFGSHYGRESGVWYSKWKVCLLNNSDECFVITIDIWYSHEVCSRCN